MKNKTLIVAFIFFLFTISTLSIGFAAESPTCDLGDIQDVSVQIDGTWYKRPDSRIDNLPLTASVGPFPVTATLVADSEIETIKLSYSEHGSNFGIVMMNIVENNITGNIPRLVSIPTSNTLLHFFLTGYDSDGHQIWVDEIPYTCPPPPGAYTQGDPYNFIIKGATAIQIDIKPNSFPNCFNLNGHGVIPAAILGSENFDVATVDITTVKFAGLDVRVRGNKGPMCHYEDVSGNFSDYPEGGPDGFDDLVCQFEDDPSMWEAGSGEAHIIGNLLPEYGRTLIFGYDSICVTQAY